MTSITAQTTKTQPTYQPVRKVTAGAIAGSLVTLTVWILNSYHPSFQLDKNKIPSEISGAATTVLTFIVSYLVSPGKNEAILIEEETAKTAKSE